MSYFFSNVFILHLNDLNMNIIKPAGSPLLRVLVLSVFFLAVLCGLKAEGTPNLRTADGDPVMLFVGNPNFGNFAIYDGPASSRLNFRVAEAGEVVYFGFGRSYRNSGVPESLGRFNYRVRRTADDSVVFGPVQVDLNSENLTSYEQAAIGPAALTEGGYPTDEDFTFTAPVAGEYYVEFDQPSNGSPRYIGLWDITIANDGVAKPGRVYSRNWAFRVPELDPQLPECAFGAELSTKFYSYTSDGFVTEIDFTDSGFQPLSFTLAFNRRGPGETGDLVLDRQSIPEQNATNNVAEHLIFLQEPDVELFPDGVCGDVVVSGTLNCQENDTYCIPITASLEGQVQVILDFNQNGEYDEETDRLLIYDFSEERGFDACVPWDGLLANGNRPAEGAEVDIVVDYNQGVQHWALYDGELMRNGFCVTPVRPICGDGGSTPLFYDDINIPDDPGNGAPKRVLAGCECRTGGCRTWTNFDAYATTGCRVNNNNTTGYGDRNTLNTWWSASSKKVTSFNVPIEAIVITGPKDHCPGEGVSVKIDYESINEIGTIRWVGPNGPLPDGNDQEVFTVTESGIYTIIVTDEFGCETTGEYMLMDVACDLNLMMMGIQCSDNGTERDRDDDTFTATVKVTGDNSSSFVYNGVTYPYGSEFEVGPFNISDGDATITATDSEYACCTETISIPAPMPCSDGCAITTGQIISAVCVDPETPVDPDDDNFYFEILIDGENLGGGWMNDRGDSGDYGVVTTFGPYPISAGAQTFQFTDVDNPSCSLGATVQPPEPCSDECLLEPKVTNALCNDNGTPFDLTDDTFTFDLSVTATNAGSPAFSVNGNGAYLYNSTVAIGPLPNIPSNYTITIADLAGNGCDTTYTLETPPTGCELACSLDITESRVVCDDNNNSDPSDDQYTVEIMVTTENPTSRGWELPNGARGAYGMFVPVGSILPGGSDLTITIFERDDPECTSSVAVRSPELVVSCPDNVDETDHKMSLQSFAGRISLDSDFDRADMEVCWMNNESFVGQRRYFERFTMARTEDGASDLRLFSFYLYAPVNNNLLGAVFSQMGEEELDCCNLSNDGPVSAGPTNPLSMPSLPDSLRPAGMVLQQRFSVALRPGQTYSLITSSPRANEVGDFRWLIASADQEELTVRDDEGAAPQGSFESISAVFDLLNFEMSEFFDNNASLASFGTPTIDSLCGEFNIAFSDDSLSTCDRALITRTFSLDLGDTVMNNVCTQEIEFRALGFTDITWPEQQIRFGCTDTFPVTAAGYPHPDYTGYPFVYRGGIPLTLGQESAFLDGLVTAYVDQEVLRPDGGSNILRTWTVQDPCRERTTTYLQTIKLENNGLPFFSCPISNHYCPIVDEDIMLWALDFDDCVADIEVPQPELNNICDSANWTFTTEILSLIDGDTILYRRLETDETRLVENVPPGDYLLRFTGEHPTENIDDRLCHIRVADLSDPVAVCKSTVNLSLPGNGEIFVPLRIFNQGSYDNCGIDTLQIRRILGDSSGWGPWSEDYLRFDCSDVGLTLEVQMEAVDAAGNRNYCTASIEINDNTEPYCVGLETVFTSCDSLPDGFNAYDTTMLRMLYGMPEVVDNCSARAVEFPPIVNGDNCSPERIRRRFQAVDEHGNLSTGLFVQDIHVTPALKYAIKFPMDTDTDCTDFFDTLVISGTGCDSITYRVVDIFLPTEGEECRYVQRNFVVTNWCEWDGVSPSIRVGRDENCSGVDGDADVWLIRTNDDIFLDADSDATNNFPAENTIGASCGGLNPAGYWRAASERPGGRYIYSQRFKVFDTTAPEITLTMLDTICVDTSLCRVPVTVGIVIDDACQVDEGSVIVGIDLNNNGVVETSSVDAGEFTGRFPNYEFTESLPVGDHRFVFTVTDDCGNTTVEDRVFRVNDCYVPALVCRGDRIYNLQPLLEEGDIDGDGVVEEAAVLVEAIDLAQCNFADCSGDLLFSLNRVGEPYDPQMGSIFLDCDDRYEVYLEVYVWDDAFNPFRVQPDGTVGGRNWRMCEVKVRLQDPDLACNSCQVEDNITINGSVNSLSGRPLDDVTVTASGAHTVTNGFGGYQIGGTVGESYVLTAAKDVDPRAGLSTLDLLILRRHMLGIETFDSPFMRVAADLNRDGEVDVLDLVALRGLILGRTEFYPDGSPWRFVDADWDGTGNPEEAIELNTLLACGFDHNFIGLRLGDFNDSFEGATAGANTGGRSNGSSNGRPTALQLENPAFRSGNEVTVTLSLRDGAEYLGGQAALRWNADALMLLSHDSEDLSAANFRATAGHLRLNWSDALTADEVVTLRFRVAADGELSDYLTLAEEETFVDEAYGVDLASHPLFLTWTEATTNTTIGEEGPVVVAPTEDALLGVLPNPASSSTRLGLSLTSGQRVELVVTDMNGRVVLSRSAELGAGEQWLRVELSKLAGGVYPFTVKTADRVLTGRIVKQ